MTQDFNKIKEQLFNELTDLRQRNQRLEVVEADYKRTNEALQRSRNELEKIQQIAHIGNWEWDIETDRIIASEKAFHIFGLAQKKYNGNVTLKSAFESTHPNDIELLSKSLQKMAIGNADKPVICRVLRPDGVVRTISIEAEINFERPFKAIGTIQDITEYKLTEEALRNSEEKFYDFIDSINDIAYIIDTTGITTYVNSSVGRLLEYKPAEIINKHFSQFLYEEDIELGIEQFNAALSGKFRTNDLRLLTKTGKIRWVQISIKPHYKDNKLSELRGIIVDITDRKLSEIALTESEEKFRLLVENSPDIIYIADSSGKILYINHATIKKIKYVLGRSVFLFILPEYHKIIKKQLRLVLQNGKAKNIEIRGINLHGSFSWYESRFVAINFNGQNVAMVLVTDISERKKAVLDLVESEERFRTVANFTYDWEYWKGPDGNFIYVSPSCERITGYNADEFIQNAELMMKIIHPDDRKKVNHHLSEANDSSHTHSMDFRIITRKGELRWISHSCQKVYSGNEKYLGTRACNRDITLRKKVEDDIVKAYHELDQIFNSTVDGMCVIDKNFNYIRVNKSFLDMFNLNKKEVMKNKCSNLHDNICNTDQCILKRIKSGESYAEIELEKETGNGNKIIYTIRSVPFLNAEGEFIGVIETFNDVTEIRNLEKEIMNIVQNERQRIGQDLHDGLGQTLTGITYMLEVLEKKMTNDSYSEVKYLRKILDFVSNATDQSHVLAKNLYPVKMEKDGLISALDEMTTNIKKIFGASCAINLKGAFQIADINTSTHLYFIAKEAVNNAIRHGKAKNISIDIIPDGKDLTMIITNDGEKTYNSKRNHNGLGLKIMEYRARMIGAKFIIEENIKNNFKISVHLKRN